MNAATERSALPPDLARLLAEKDAEIATLREVIRASRHARGAAEGARRMTRAELLALAERVEAATGPDRELEAEIMFDLYAVPVGKASDGGPCGYLWPEDDPSWNFGIRFPGRDRAWFKQQRAGKGQETLLIERDGALVLMNSLRIPPLMSSVDAAASLMPPDYCVEVVGRDGHGWHCSAWKNVTWPPLASHPDDQSEAGAPILKINAQAKDEARARLAAALRVRATEVGE